MSRPRAGLLLASLLATTLPAPAQGRAARGPMGDERALKLFDSLTPVQQAMLVRRIERRVLESGHPLVARIASLRIDPTALPAPEPRRCFEPAEWAPVAAARRPVSTRSTAYQRVRRQIPTVAVMPELPRAVRYDWRSGKLARGDELSYRDLFRAFLAGFPPGADHAEARVTAALDRDPKMRALADYFGHTYTDRDGGVYEGITLYEAWYSGTTLEMPDVDVIPFAVRILDDHSYVAPIPTSRHEGLYARIRDAALAYRKHRTMVEAAAAAYVRDEPDMDPTYARLVPRFHYLLATLGDDAGGLARIADLLRQVDGRDAMIELVDRQVTSDPGAMERREGRREQLASMALMVRRAAVEELEATQ